MEELLRQLVEELDRVHVVAESDRLFELVEKARTLLGESAPLPTMCEPSSVTCEDVKDKDVVWAATKGWEAPNSGIRDWTHPGPGKSSYVQPGELLLDELNRMSPMEVQQFKDIMKSSE